jgi:hypothetical protein
MENVFDFLKEYKSLFSLDIECWWMTLDFFGVNKPTFLAFTPNFHYPPNTQASCWVSGVG